jgi:hypothetical protein
MARANLDAHPRQWRLSHSPADFLVLVKVLFLGVAPLASQLKCGGLDKPTFIVALNHDSVVGPLNALSCKFLHFVGAVKVFAPGLSGVVGCYRFEMCHNLRL